MAAPARRPRADVHAAIVLSTRSPRPCSGGLESPVGAVAGAYMLGVGLSLLGAVRRLSPTPELRLPIALGVLLLVLLVKPTGLFGRTVVRRV